MIIARRKRKENIAEYLLYMWQVEDLIRANGLDIERIKANIIDPYPADESQRKALTQWYEELIDMMHREGVAAGGHLQINKIVMQQLVELNAQLLQSTKYPFYNSEYYKVLPFIVELRKRGAGSDENEIETCFNALYGVMMLRLQKKKISPDTEHAIKEISTFIGMLSDYYLKDKKEPLEFD